MDGSRKEPDVLMAEKKLMTCLAEYQQLTVVAKNMYVASDIGMTDGFLVSK